MLGRYKADLIGSYGQDNNLPLVATLTFWVFPWKLAVIITLVVVAIILGTVYYRRKKKSGPKAPEEPKEENKKEYAEDKIS